MKIAIVALAVLVTAGCGSSSGDSGSTKAGAVKASAAAASASAAVAAAKKETCDKIGREWAVKAKDLNSKFALGLAADSQELLDEMNDAVDQMDVELCPKGAGTVRDLASVANYKAAVINAKLLGCSMDLDCSLDLAEKWTKTGTPLLVQVESLVGLS